MRMKKLVKIAYVIFVCVVAFFSFWVFIAILAAVCVSTALLIVKHPKKYGRLYGFFFGNYVVLVAMLCYALSLYISCVLLFDYFMIFVRPGSSPDELYKRALYISAAASLVIGIAIIYALIPPSKKLLRFLRAKAMKCSKTLS